MQQQGEISMPSLSKDEKAKLAQFNELWLTACKGASVEDLKAIAPDYEKARIDQIVIAATMPIAAIIKMVGSQNDFSLRYCISKGTIQSWCAEGKSNCPPHLRLIFCRELKLI